MSELIKQSQTNDKEEFEVLAEKYYPLVLRQAYLKLKNHALAEEVTQAVFILFYQKKYSLSHTNYLAWLYKTTQFVCLNAQKIESRKAINEKTYYDINKDIKSSNHNIEEDLEELFQAMESLNHRQQNFIMMRFVHGMSFKEIATELDMSENAAQLATSKAQNKLVKALKKRGVVYSIAFMFLKSSKFMISTSEAQIKKCILQAKLVDGGATAGISTPWLLSKMTSTMLVIKKAQMVALFLVSLGTVALVPSILNVHAETSDGVEEVEDNNLPNITLGNEDSNQKMSFILFDSRTYFIPPQIKDKYLQNKINWLANKSKESLKVGILKKTDEFKMPKELGSKSSPRLTVLNGKEGYILNTGPNEGYEYKYTGYSEAGEQLNLDYKIKIFDKKGQEFDVEFRDVQTLQQGEILVVQAKDNLGQLTVLMLEWDYRVSLEDENSKDDKKQQKILADPML